MLAEIYADMERDPAFDHLRTPGIRFVPGWGRKTPGGIMFIGEAPGEKENETGVPFSGRAGEKLNDLLDSIEMFGDDYFVTNILKHRPPNNRDPYPSEIRAARPYLSREIKAIQPSLIVPLGKIATQAFFPVARFKDVRGILHERDGKPNILPLYHPAFACYNEGRDEELTVIREFSLIRSVYGTGATP